MGCQCATGGLLHGLMHLPPAVGPPPRPRCTIPEPSSSTTNRHPRAAAPSRWAAWRSTVETAGDYASAIKRRSAPTLRPRAHRHAPARRRRPRSRRVDPGSPARRAGGRDHGTRQRRGGRPGAEARRVRFHLQAARPGGAAQADHRHAQARATEPSRTPAATPTLRLLGDSKPMQQLRQMIGKVARSQAPVHISGDSGTGKELVARLIHDTGPRRDGPFVPVNCGAIPSELMESELFGHKKGSFTGAVADKEGPDPQRRGRHAVPRRSGRPAAAHAGQAAARDPGEVRAAGRRDARESRSTCASSPRRTASSTSW